MVTGGAYNDLVIPFTRDVVTKIDIDDGKLTVELPEGFLDPPDKEAT